MPWLIECVPWCLQHVVDSLDMFGAVSLVDIAISLLSSEAYSNLFAS